MTKFHLYESLHKTRFKAQPGTLLFLPAHGTGQPKFSQNFKVGQLT